MELTHDYIHPTPHGGRCRVRIYDATTTVLPVIVCTELTDNPGQSITNAAQQIAAEVLENHPHVFDPFALASIAGLSYDKPFVWVEHYEDGARGTPEDRAGAFGLRPLQCPLAALHFSASCSAALALPRACGAPASIMPLAALFLDTFLWRGPSLWRP